MVLSLFLPFFSFFFFTSGLLPSSSSRTLPRFPSVLGALTRGHVSAFIIASSCVATQTLSARVHLFPCALQANRISLAEKWTTHDRHENYFEWEYTGLWKNTWFYIDPVWFQWKNMLPYKIVLSMYGITRLAWNLFRLCYTFYAIK